MYKLDSNRISYFLEDWKDDITQYDNVIIFDSGYRKGISSYIKRKNPKCKIILYYWNIIKEDNEKFLKDKNIDEIWTFDIKDSTKYNIKYNPQFYTKNIVLEEQDKEIELYFLGKDKGRRKDILDIEEKMRQYGIITNFTIVENKLKNPVPYDEYLKKIKKTKAILDVLDPRQEGLTLRSLEALFLNKKLITTNKRIKELDFYNRQNIFILEEDKIENIKEFINSKNEKIDEKIIDYYDFSNWRERFF